MRARIYLTLRAGWLFVLAVVPGFRNGHAVGLAAAADETQVRAAMILNLTKFVDWPARKFVDSSAPLILCFAVNDPVGDEVDFMIRGKETGEMRSHDRPLVVRRIVSSASLESCHLFYSSRPNNKKLMDNLPGLARSAVLTITDDSSKNGAVIALPLLEEHVKILVDLRAAQRSDLTLSSRLLKIAVVTK